MDATNKSIAAASDPADTGFMQRVLDLARRGRGSVEPNPMVACAIVKDGRLIAQGYHQLYGGPHAEAIALDAAGDKAAGSTIYVNLEPCCHTAKQTPPCAPRLIGARVARVVIGCADRNPQVSGRGITQLRHAGIDVRENVLADESQQLNAAYIKRVQTRRPYVTLKWAQSADGKVAGGGGQRRYISNDKSHAILHQLRARCDAILVGIRTVLLDDPLLTVRGIAVRRPPLRVVLDSHLRIPVTSQLMRTTSIAPVTVYCAEDAFHQRYALVAALQAHGVEVVPLPAQSEGELSLPAFLDNLGKRNVTNLLVEPGPTIAGSFIQQNLADRVWIFHSPMKIEDATAPAAQPITYPPTGQVMLDEDRLTEYLNPQSPVFFKLDQSADFAMAR